MDIFYWNEFCDTNDIQYLNFISYEGKQILKTFLNKNVKYKDLQRLINLYFIKSWENIPYCKHLHGISSLSYHQKDKIKIYIFGENTISFPTHCQAFKYVLSLLRNEPKFIDIYIDIKRLSSSSIKELYNVKFHDITNLTPHGKQINLFDNNKSNNIILFIDDKYTNIYRELLKNKKFKTINHAKINEFNYVVLDKFKFPLFS